VCGFRTPVVRPLAYTSTAPRIPVIGPVDPVRGRVTTGHRIGLAHRRVDPNLGRQGQGRPYLGMVSGRSRGVGRAGLTLERARRMGSRDGVTGWGHRRRPPPLGLRTFSRYPRAGQRRRRSSRDALPRWPPGEGLESPHSWPWGTLHTTALVRGCGGVVRVGESTPSTTSVESTNPRLDLGPPSFRRRSLEIGRGACSIGCDAQASAPFHPSSLGSDPGDARWLWRRRYG
jgi:hypothetical protein